MKKTASEITFDETQRQQFRQQLLDWYAAEQRDLPWRSSGLPYQIWVSEAMLQQTQVATVIPYFYRFLAAFPNIASLADAEPQQVLKLWEGLGYYSRARNLQKAAQQMVEKFGGEIPADYEAFRQLPGVGPYIAAAVQSIAFDQPYAVVDGNVKRVLARLL
ncbi:MAG: A/G-specific adenine glycosylase, partial [Calditrichaeota bacterium]|nr:A/G-specific adenine glycosylase [Calditrichota bacterium]